jgi:WD40 repeat protein
VTGWPNTTGDSVNSSPALGDIDGDGDIEVVVGSRDKKVYVWHHDGSAVTGWPNTTGGSVHSSPALGDIDGDGDIEVVVGSEDGKVYAWDCFGTYDSNNIEWGMFHHDINHTGLYGYVPPGTGGTGSQTALKEAAWLSEDPTNGAVDPGTQTSITVTFNTTTLDFGDYYADIIITSNDPDENPLIIPVHLTVGHTDIGGFATDFGRADCIGDCPGDSDGDGDVDGSDLAEFAKNLGLQNP